MRIYICKYRLIHSIFANIYSNKSNKSNKSHIYIRIYSIRIDRIDPIRIDRIDRIDPDSHKFDRIYSHKFDSNRSNRSNSRPIRMYSNIFDSHIIDSHIFDLNGKMSYSTMLNLHNPNRNINLRC